MNVGDLQAYQGTEGHPQRLPLVLGLPACCLILSVPCSVLWLRGSQDDDTHFVLSIGSHTIEEAELFSMDVYWNAYWCQKIRPTQTNWLLHTRSCISRSNWLPYLNRPCRSSPAIPIHVLLTFPMTCQLQRRHREGLPGPAPGRCEQGMEVEAQVLHRAQQKILAVTNCLQCRLPEMPCIIISVLFYITYMKSQDTVTLACCLMLLRAARQSFIFKHS